MRDVLDQLDSGGIDVALSTLADGGERFKCVRIMDDDYVVLLDAARAEAVQDPYRWRRWRPCPYHHHFGRR